MEDNTGNLQINITANDEASEVMAGLADEAQAMGDEISGAFASTQGSMDAFEASVAGLTDVMSVDTDAITGDMLAVGTSFDEAATMAATASADIEASLGAEGAEATVVGLENEVGNLKTGFATILGVALPAFLAVETQIKDAVGDAQTWNQSLTLLSTELKNAGSSIPISQFTNYAEAVQKSTLFSDQQALASEGILVQNKQLGASWEANMTIAENLATKMGTDLPTAAKLLADTLVNPVDEMKKLVNAGLDVSPLLANQIREYANTGDAAAGGAILIGLMNTQFKDLATNAAAAPGAGLTQLQNSLGTLNRTLGDDMLPAFDAMSKDLGPIVTDFTNWAAAFPKLSTGLELSALALTGIAVSIGLIGIAAPGFKIVWGILEGLADATIAAGFLAIAGSIGLGAGILGALMLMNDYVQAQFGGNWSSFWGAVGDAFSHPFLTMKQAVIELEAEIQNLWNEVQKFFGAGGPSSGGVASSIGSALVGALTNFGHIMGFADGGIVTSPQLAMVGEAGPEAIIPLSMLGTPSAMTLGSGNGGAINVYITGTVQSTADQAKTLGDMIAKQIGRTLKLTSIK